jgi:hypothetical protein
VCIPAIGRRQRAAQKPATVTKRKQTLKTISAMEGIEEGRD